MRRIVASTRAALASTDSSDAPPRDSRRRRSAAAAADTDDDAADAPARQRPAPLTLGGDSGETQTARRPSEITTPPMAPAPPAKLGQIMKK